MSTTRSDTITSLNGRHDTYRRYSIPGTVTVQVDSREQFPILFPGHITIPNPADPNKRCVIRVQVQKTKLDAGDYRLREHPGICGIERKGSAAELVKNLFDSYDMVRQAHAFRRLRGAYRFPMLLLEMSAESLTKPVQVGSRVFEDHEALLHRLFLVQVKYGLELVWLPWRRAGANRRRELGTILTHLMVARAVHQSIEALPELVGETSDGD